MPAPFATRDVVPGDACWENSSNAPPARFRPCRNNQSMPATTADPKSTNPGVSVAERVLCFRGCQLIDLLRPLQHRLRGFQTMIKAPVFSKEDRDQGWWL